MFVFILGFWGGGGRRQRDKRQEGKKGDGRGKKAEYEKGEWGICSYDRGSTGNCALRMGRREEAATLEENAK